MSRGVDRFSPVQAYDTFLETLVVEPADDGYATPMLVCTECTESLCLIDEGDTMLLLINTALHHECEGVQP